MKYFFYIFSLIGCLQLNAQQNSYTPYVSGWGSTWSYEGFWVSSWGPEFYNYIREWGGDTIFDSKVYTKIYDGYGANRTYLGGLHEDLDTKKVLFRTIYEEEFDISFDQQALVGDTIKAFFNYIDLFNLSNSVEKDSMFIVEAIETTYINQVETDHFVLSPLNDGYKLNFVPGIGIVSKQDFERGEGLACLVFEYNIYYGYPEKPACVASISELENEFKVHVYPNPSQDDFTIEFPFSEKADILLLDLKGKVIYKQRVENSNKYLLNHNLKKGIYILHVRLDNHVNSSQKIVIE